MWVACCRLNSFPQKLVEFLQIVFTQMIEVFF